MEMQSLKGCNLQVLLYDFESGVFTSKYMLFGRVAWEG